METDKWCGWYMGAIRCLEVPDDVVSNPKSFYNSREGKKIREFSNKLFLESKEVDEQKV